MSNNFFKYGATARSVAQHKDWKQEETANSVQVKKICLPDATACLVVALLVKLVFLFLFVY